MDGTAVDFQNQSGGEIIPQVETGLYYKTL